MLHFLSEDVALRFIEEANTLGIEWSPSQVIDQGRFVSIRIMSVGNRHELHKLMDLYESKF
jgi:hypothetical protein